MASASPSAPFWSTSLPNSQANLEDTHGAVAAALSSPWPRSSSLDTDSPLLAYHHSMQGARLAAAIASQGPSACCSPYHLSGGIAQRPQLRTTHGSSPIPISGRLQGPPTAPAYYGHRSTVSHGDLPAIEVSPDWLSAGAQPLMIGAPWRNQAHDLEGLSGSQNGDLTLATLATPESSTTAPLDIGPFEMDPVITSDPSSAAGAGVSASTHETPGDMLPWGQSAEQSYSQGAEQFSFTWLSKYLTTLDAPFPATPASHHSLPSENGSVHHSSPASSPQQDHDMTNRMCQAHFEAAQIQSAVGGAHFSTPQDPLSVLTTNPAHLPNISKRRPSEDVASFIEGQRAASVVRSKHARRSLQPSQTPGMQYPSARHSYSPYQRTVSSSPLHRRAHVRQLSGSDAPLPSSIVSPHDSGIFLSPQQLHSRTDSFSSSYNPGPPSVGSSVGSLSREPSLGVFHSPGDQGYEMSGGFFFNPAMHLGADKAHDDSANTLQLVIPTNPIQLPQPLPVPQIRHSIAYPVTVGPPAAPSPTPNWYPKPQQTKEGKLQIDHAMINASFRDAKDPLSAQRRLVLERVLQSIWFQSHELEPKVSGPYDELTGGLGVGGRSVYTCFLKFMSTQEGNGHGSTGSGGKWVCLFGDETHPCPKARWEEGFNKPERAIEHIRSHLGHRPFWCNNECGSNPACTWKFFANSHRYDHWKKPHKRSHCDVCGESVQAQNLVRHLETHAREDA